MNIQDKFWSFFNEVRGSKDIGELREIVISLIFLKHANDEYASNPFSKISVPSNSEWGFLYNNFQKNNFLDILYKAFLSLENENEQIRGTFSYFDFFYKFNNNIDLGLVKKLFIKISEFGLLEDVSFSKFIGILLSKFSVYEGRNVTSFITPESVSNLMVQLLNPKEGSILDSTCGTGGFFQKIEDYYPSQKFQFYGQDLNGSILAITKLRFAFNHKNSFQFGESKSTLTDNQFPELKSDFVIMHPPLNIRNWQNATSHFDPRFEYGIPPKNNANIAWVQHTIHHLKSKGKAVVLLAQNSLFTNLKAEVAIRKNIIENNLLEAIITLPNGLLNYSGVKTCIWILNKEKLSEKIILIDSELFVEKEKKQSYFPKKALKEINKIYNDFKEVKDVSKIVEIEEIRENNYSLYPQQYFDILIDDELSNPVQLNTFVNTIKVKRSLNIKRAIALSIKDLSNNVDNFKINISDLEDRENLKNHSTFKGRALLLATVGGKLKPSFIDTLNQEIAIQNNVATFTVDENKVLIEFLIQELNKEYVNKQLLRFIKGAAIQHINKKDLLSLIIDVPNLTSQQSDIVKREKKIRFEKLVLESGFQKQLESFKKEQEADLSSKRHMLNQDVSSLNSVVEYLKGEFIMRKKGIQLDTVLDERDGTTMHMLLDSLSETVKIISDQVNLLSNDSEPLIKEVFDVKLFLKKLVNRETSKYFKIISIFDEDEYNTRIKADKKQFKNVFKSILNNAIRHGFIDNSKDNVFKISLVDNGSYIDLLMENNGKPLPKGVTKESYSTKSMKAGKTGNTGLGGYHVGLFAKSHDLKWDLINSENEEFTVGVLLKLKKYEKV
ncbi:N-6 DNA methylase [Polaribacter marinivivus]|uniref:N-6 DNA methylase n=1 Tax=Polaribacter marinivivus TaxID=1524260 RepID=UPI003D33CFC6